MVCYAMIGWHAGTRASAARLMIKRVFQNFEAVEFSLQPSLQPSSPP
jgi:hypothetical protein